MSEISSAILKARYHFYKKHPEIAACQANDNLIEAWATENVLSLELPNNWNIALNALENRLAKTTANEAEPTATPPPAAPIAAETPAEPDLRNLSVPELRKIVKGQRTRFEKVLPSIYTPEKIKAMPPSELRHLQTMYGSKALNARLGSK